MAQQTIVFAEYFFRFDVFSSVFFLLLLLHIVPTVEYNVFVYTV